MKAPHLVILFGVVLLHIWVDAAPNNQTATSMYSNTTLSPTFPTAPPAWTTTPPANIPTITLPPLPPEFSDMPKDSMSCYSAWATANVRNEYIEAKRGESYACWDSSFPATTTTSTLVSGPCSMMPANWTTLCDGYPRRYDYPGQTCNSTSTITSLLPAHTDRACTWPEWYSSYRVPLPTCQPAPNLEPLCYRLHSVYSWQTSQLKASATLSRNINASITYPAFDYRKARPPCKTLKETAPPNLPSPHCAIQVNNYQVFFWPPDTPLSGPDICNTNFTPPPGTRTIPWLPNTAIVSGLTLTSPSVYHMLTGITIYTSIGKSRGGRWVGDVPVWNISTTIPSPTVLTLPQEISDVWTARPTHYGRGIRHVVEWNYTRPAYNPLFFATAPADKYFDSCKDTRYCRKSDGYILQGNYRQWAALNVSELLAEWDSDEFRNCDWREPEPVRGREDTRFWIAGSGPWVAHAIVTDAGEEETSVPTPVPGETGEMLVMATRSIEEEAPEATETEVENE
ncbi:uncharacterized protein BDR25DRAFT_342495 [Lindgomyces ingoldianus]|uniref:Uncharacterized protein n=1 Tax=Lindgomyces ingoldianus TaxID=673940 RepID=A0ACB6QYI3_9PLEO|nr:uncharacterized protein BDR25DRAFT_342495 [Lindgomyces ingoldianus]KAF2471140.1 hypothetical protein BDR25DRAFT_342495 [Lindgomyces ingoldianus]